MVGSLVARWFLGGEMVGGEMVGGEIPWWRDDRIPLKVHTSAIAEVIYLL